MRTFTTVQSYQAHLGAVTSLDVKDNYIVTCGLSKRFGINLHDLHANIHSSGYFDASAKLYDLRVMKPLPPIIIHPYQTDPSPTFEPFICKFHPLSSNNILLATYQGQFLFYDLSNHITQEKLEQEVSTQMNYAVEGILCVDISSNGEIIAFGDISGNASEWCHVSKVESEVMINHSSKVTEIVEINPPPSIPLHFESSLASFVFPSLEHYTHLDLLSNWDNSLNFPVTHPSPQIDGSVFPDFKQVDFVGYAKNPGLKRNMTSNVNRWYLNSSTAPFNTNHNSSISTSSSSSRSNTRISSSSSVSGT